MIIKRNIINVLYEDLFEKNISILVGARQVGKTFLLKKIAEKACKDGKKTAFFDLEQPDTLASFNKPDSELVKLLCNSGEVIFIDEFHYLKNASHIFKAIYDSEKNIKIFASGSSSLEMHKHLKESLAGRKLIYNIYPCSYSEIGHVIKEKAFEYYVIFGGLPGLIHTEDKEKKKLILYDILQSYILKDIKSLIKEENIRAFNNLLYILAQNQGSIVTTSNLASEVGLTAKTIEAHLELLSLTYVCFNLSSYSVNLANELKKSKKYYLYDLGIRNMLLKNFHELENRNDKGIILESFVFLELYKQLSVDSDLKFWRLKDGTEVDFIFIKNQIAYPIEVKASWNSKQIPKGIVSFINRYPKTTLAFVVSTNAAGENQYKNTRIIYINMEQVSTIVSAII